MRKPAAFVALFGVVALAAILPPMFCLSPERVVSSPSPPTRQPAEHANVLQMPPGTPGCSVVFSMPAVYVTVPGCAASVLTGTIYAHNADELVVGCSCDRCQAFGWRNR